MALRGDPAWTVVPDQGHLVATAGADAVWLVEDVSSAVVDLIACYWAPDAPVDDDLPDETRPVAGCLPRRGRPRLSLGLACRGRWDDAAAKAWLEWAQGTVFAGLVLSGVEGMARSPTPAHVRPRPPRHLLHRAPRAVAGPAVVGRPSGRSAGRRSGHRSPG